MDLSNLSASRAFIDFLVLDGQYQVHVTRLLFPMSVTDIFNWSKPYFYWAFSNLLQTLLHTCRTYMWVATCSLMQLFYRGVTRGGRGSHSYVKKKKSSSIHLRLHVRLYVFDTSVLKNHNPFFKPCVLILDWKNILLNTDRLWNHSWEAPWPHLAFPSFWNWPVFTLWESYFQPSQAERYLRHFVQHLCVCYFCIRYDLAN